MARKKKEKCNDPGKLQHWLELLGDCKRYNDKSPDGWLFGFLNNVYTTAEIEQLKIACEKLDLVLVISKKGGDVYGKS